MNIILCTAVALSIVGCQISKENAVPIKSYRNDICYEATNPGGREVINDYIGGLETNASGAIIGPGGPIVPIINLSPSIYKELDYQSRFFRNLISNKPSNYDGVCGYTAISMLLSYYDNYANSSIISSQYETGCVSSFLGSTNDNSDDYESPGVKDDYVSAQNYYRYLEQEEYKIGHYVYNEYGEIVGMDDTYKLAYENGILDYLNANIDSGSFLGKLFSIAVDNGCYNTHTDTDPYLTGIGTNYNILSTVLSDYLSQLPESLNLSMYSGAVTSNTSQERSRIRSEIISSIQSGRPVVVGGNFTYYDSPISDSNKVYGHAVVAYEYDEENDIIYCNMGYDRFGTIKNVSNQHQAHANMDDFFNIQISDYYGINIDSDTAHSHSKKYSISGSISKICSCELDSHVHNYKYECYDVDKHYRQCFCNMCASFQNHVYYREVLVNGRYYSECLCGYLRLSGNGPIPGV